MKQHNIWVEKYRPKTIEDYIASDDFKLNVNKWIKELNIPHLLLYSTPGTGKTSLAKIIINALDCSYLYINASDERGIDTIRDKVQGFAQAASFKPLKIVILDEADYLTTQAQASLRNIIETYSLNTRFILTCNYLDRIIDPLKSRCQAVKITPPSKELVYMYTQNILEKENVTFKDTELATIINKSYPDVRSILNNCQHLNKDGVLTLDTIILDNNFLSKILDELKKPTSSSWKNIRQIITDSNVEEFETTYKFLYDNVESYGKNKESQIIIKIEEYMYHSSFRIDKEINIMACINSIIEIIK